MSTQYLARPINGKKKKMILGAFWRTGLRIFKVTQKRNYSPAIRICDMSSNKVIVTHVSETTTVGISFRYKDEDRKIDKIFNLQRAMEEETFNILNRIINNISKAANNKKKRKTQSLPVEEEDVSVKLVKLSDGGNVPVPDEMSCYESFVTQAANHNLVIGSQSYAIDLNPPIVKGIDLPRNIMAGYSVYPTKLNLAFCEKEQCQFQWLKSDKKFDSVSEAQKNLGTIQWLDHGSGRVCHTYADDIGRLLKVVVKPFDGEREGEAAEALANVLVSAGPGECPFHRRQKQFTSELAPEDCIRVISYNILADMYAASETSRKNLFPSCPAYAMAIDYRKQLLITEITGYLGDLVCLQEVDEKVFHRDLMPAMAEAGLDGHYTAKGRNVTEGSAFFYRREKLRLLEKIRVMLNQELQTNVLFADLWEKVKANPDLTKRILELGTILQVSILESVGNRAGAERILVVGGTHLFFYPDADHIRLIQSAICLTFLRQIMQLYQVKYPEKDVSLIFCGDFNSTPEFGVYRYMTQQWIGPDDSDWTTCEETKEHVKGITLSHDLELGSACGIPEYTNYTPLFNGCLDYIFYQTDKYDVKQVVPLPSHEEVTEHIALPSPTFPSDHLPLIADLQFKYK